MHVSSKNECNTQSPFHANGKNPYVMKSGLQGDELEAAKTARKISVALDELATKLMKKGRSRDEVFEIIRTSTFIGPQASRALINLNRTYQPLNDSRRSFAYAYLISIPPAVLHVFRPFLVQYLEDPAQRIGPNMWVTRKSIEIYLALEDGQPEWWDLKFLTVEQIKTLPALVSQTGRPPHHAGGPTQVSCETKQSCNGVNDGKNSAIAESRSEMSEVERLFLEIIEMDDRERSSNLN